jgi:GntR family transcriptional regulator, rspAB operon transcriptional repressor
MLDIAEPSPTMQPKRRADGVYHVLKRAILLRERLPGDMLLEQDLAQEMSCSQGTVREALMRLSQDGLVTRRGYRGTIVSQTTAEEAALLAAVRIRIETQAASRAAAAAGPGDFDEPHAIVAAMRESESARDTYALSELDHQFHGWALRMAGLQSVEPILTRCMLHLHRHTVGNPERRTELRNDIASDAHERLLGEIRTGDAARVETAARDHIEAVIRRWSPDVWKLMAAG